MRSIIFSTMPFVYSVQVPCVGISIGIERIFSIMEAKAEVAAQFDLRLQCLHVSYPFYM